MKMTRKQIETRKKKKRHNQEIRNELLNKVSSQELHVVNTTANFGWKVKRNALQNMSVGELEQRGAQTGLVLGLDELVNAEKIQPNQTPSGLDRISYKAEEHIKSISGRIRAPSVPS